MQYRFEQCELHLADRTVWVGGEQRAVGPKVFAMLKLLIENRRRVVSRAEFVQVVWHGRAVSDAVLSRTVSRCRKAIDDDQREQPLIRARWGSGYQFVAEVQTLAPPTADVPARQRITAAQALDLAPPPVVPKAWVAPGFDVATGVMPAGTQGAGSVVLAVLPARAHTLVSPHGWLCAGLAELLGHALSMEQRLSLLPVSAVHDLLRAAPGDSIWLQARQVWARHPQARILATSIRLHGNGLQLQAQLLSHDGRHQDLPSAHDADPMHAVRQLAQAVEEALFASDAVAVAVDPELADPFLAHAYVRASQALERMQWQTARRLAEVVLDAVPNSLGAGLLLLQALARCEPETAPALGERLLKEATGQMPDPYVATVHMALAQSLWQHPLAAQRQRAQEHMRRALDLAEHHPPSDWTIRIQLAHALATELGENHHLARPLYQRAESMARAGGHRLRATLALSGRAYIDFYEGRVQDARDALAEVVHEAHALRLPAQTAFALAMQSEAQRSLGDLGGARQSVDQALCQLQAMPQSDVGSLAAYVAYAASGVAQDTADYGPLSAALMLSGDDRGRVRARQRVFQGIARARLRLHTDGWPLARAELVQTVQAGQDHALGMMVLLVKVIWSDLAMIAGDADGVAEAVQALRQLGARSANDHIRCAIMQAEAWQAHVAGDVASARGLLQRVCATSSEVRSCAVARLDAAWLAVEAGALDLADELIDATGQWRLQPTLGLAVAARLSAARGRWQVAADLMSQARRGWKAGWPEDWQALQDAWSAASGSAASRAARELAPRRLSSLASLTLARTALGAAAEPLKRVA